MWRPLPGVGDPTDAAPTFYYQFCINNKNIHSNIDSNSNSRSNNKNNNLGFCFLVVDASLERLWMERATATELSTKTNDFNTRHGQRKHDH